MHVAALNKTESLSAKKIMCSGLATSNDLWYSEIRKETTFFLMAHCFLFLEHLTLLIAASSSFFQDLQAWGEKESSSSWRKLPWLYYLKNISLHYSLSAVRFFFLQLLQFEKNLIYFVNVCFYLSTGLLAWLMYFMYPIPQIIVEQ